nr:M13 family metallopeptidase [uncultured Pseudoxanthomonas sp.]
MEHRRLPWPYHLPTVLAVLVILSACQRQAAPEAAAGSATPAPPSTARPQLGAWGVDLAGMDRAIKPGDDFYAYVNGAWQAAAQIPADKAEVGPAATLQDTALEQCRTLLEEAAADTAAPKGSDRQKLGDWYATLLDETLIDANGLAPLTADLDRINAITDRTRLADVLAENNAGLGARPIGLSADFDRKRVNTMVLSIEVGGLSVGAREVYIDPGYAPVRTQLREHIARMFALADIDDGDARAARVLELETRIAKAMWSATELRDRSKRFNLMPVGDVATLAPGIDWVRFLAKAGVEAPAMVNVSTPSTTTGIARLVADVPLQDWRDYLTYHLLIGTQTYLPKKFRDEAFSFYGKTLQGQQQSDPRWKQALFDLGWSERPLGDALGQAFIARYVPAESRPQAQEMIGHLLTAFDARLDKLEWMAAETKAGAREKLAKLTVKAIYPDAWQSTDGLEVVRGDAIGNARRAAAFIKHREMAWLKTLPDRRIFIQPVYVVNAYAMAPWNEIVFLAAIMRPPFFDPHADKAVNYGAMGAVMGHELSHLFDDQGRQTDADGLLRDWWTPADAERFVTATDRLAVQVSTYEPLPGKHVNGKLTLGESIADVAGLTVSHDAYRRSLQGEEPPVIDGFTADQRFFLAYAQMWRWKPRDAYLDQLLKTDTHPPTFVRPNTVRNIDAWYTAFDVKPGDKLYLRPEERINPW